MDKRGLAMRTIVILIVLIIGFAIVLIFFALYPWKGTIDKEACHQSIVLRSTFNYGPIEGKKAIPLRCKTEKVCLTMSREDCEAFGKPSRKNPVTKVKLSKDVSKAREGIKDVIANVMYDCHSMLGEGKLDFMPHGFKGANYCLICSRIAFDEKTKEEIGDISYGEFYRYLDEEVKTPDERSYLEYLYPGWENWEDSKKLFEELQKKSGNEDFKKLRFEDWKLNLDFDDGYAIISQMAPKGTWEKWLQIGSVAVAGIAAVVGIVSIPFSGPAGAAIAVAATKVAIGTATVAGGAIYIYNHPNNKYKWIPPSIFPYDVDALRGLECTSFETAP